MSPLGLKGTTARVVALAGAAGLVGRAITEGLLAGGSVTARRSLGRGRFTC
jgi:nucleoside-diphosphate-sugar epimerase